MRFITFLCLIALNAGISGCNPGKISGAGIFLLSDFQANSNDVATVSREVNSDEFRELIANVSGTHPWRLRRLIISFQSDDMSWYEFSPPLDKRTADIISSYLLQRADGHSKEYCFAALRQRATLANITNEDYRVIQKQEDSVPIDLIRVVGTTTNKDGSINKAYFILDGNIAWSYDLCREPSGVLKYCSSIKYDAVEFNPDYTNEIAQVEHEVRLRMKKEGSYGQLGSCHTFWRLKKELLEEKGIDWRLPSELNPNSCFD